LFVLFYAGQRFVWEFLKPYATVISQFNLFHIVAAFMIAYAIFMLLISSTQPKDIQKHA